MIGRALGITGVVAVALAGCAGGGGGGGSTGSTAGAAQSSGPDQTPPEIVVSEPLRGAFLPAGPVRVAGRVTDTGAGVASLTVQGVPVAFGPGGDFATTVRLETGVAAITLTAIDAAGNRTNRALAVETGAWLPPGVLAPEGLAGRLNQASLQLMSRMGAGAIASSLPLLTASLQAMNPIYSTQLAPGGFCIASVEAAVNTLSFGTPALSLGSTTQGLDFRLDVPGLAVAVTADDRCGIPYTVQGGFTADRVEIHAVAQLGIGQAGALDVTFPVVDVQLDNFHFSLGGALSWLAPIAEGIVKQQMMVAVEDLVRNDGAAAIRSLVARSLTMTLAAAPTTFSYGLSRISTDADGIAFVVGVDLAMQPDPTYPVAPGSLQTYGAPPAAFATGPGLVLSLSETAINRVLDSAWHAGVLATDVVPLQVAQSFGVPLPFGTTAADLAAFFPVLRGVIPSQNLASPLIFKIRSLLPPTARIVAGAPDPLRLSFGEYHLTAAVDLGAGQSLDVFTISMQAELEVGIDVKNGALVPVMSTLPNPPIFVDLIEEPLVHLGAAHLESYLDAILPVLLGGVVSSLPPIPLPALPAGATLVAASMRGEGASGTYLTLEADVR